jgi:hypothetical protein
MQVSRLDCMQRHASCCVDRAACMAQICIQATSSATEEKEEEEEEEEHAAARGEAMSLPQERSPGPGTSVYPMRCES